ncbi:PEGA domain-containing protein [Myxococcota bacterium]|nr:PEGA domain-containing protein [Myxococcota bacterium]
MSALLVLGLALAVIGADDGVEEARELHRAGSEAYRQGEYTTAIDAFEEAYRLAPRAPVVFSLAQAHRLQYFVDGDVARLARAVELYRQYLTLVDKGGRRDDAAQLLATLEPILDRRRGELGRASTPTVDQKTTGRVIVSSRIDGAVARIDGGDAQKIPATFEVLPGEHRVLVEAPEHRPKALETVAILGTVVALNVELEPEPGQLSISAPDGATINVDGRVIAASSATEPVELAPGRHLVTVTARGHEPFVEPVELGRGQALALTADLSVTTQRVAAYSLFVGSGVVLAGAAVAAGVAFDAESSARPIEARQDARQSLTVDEARRYAALEARRDDYVRVAAGAAIAGTGAALAGLFLYLFDEPQPPRTPLVVPSTAGLGATATFTF